MGRLYSAHLIGLTALEQASRRCASNSANMGLPCEGAPQAGIKVLEKSLIFSIALDWYPHTTVQQNTPAMSGNGDNDNNSSYNRSGYPRVLYNTTIPIPIQNQNSSTSSTSMPRSADSGMMFPLSIGSPATQNHPYYSQQYPTSQPSNPQAQNSNHHWFASNPNEIHPDFQVFQYHPLSTGSRVAQVQQRAAVAGSRFYGNPQTEQVSYPAAQHTQRPWPCRRFACTYNQHDFGTQQARDRHEAEHSSSSF